MSETKFFCKGYKIQQWVDVGLSGQSPLENVLGIDLKCLPNRPKLDI